MAHLRLPPLHLCWFVLVGALTAASASLLGVGAGELVALLLLLPALGLIPEGYRRLSGRSDELHGLAMALSVVTVLGVGRYWPDLVTLLRTPAQTIHQLAELADHPNAVSFKFTAAGVRTDYAYRWDYRSHDERRGGTTLLSYRVAPITSADWTPAEPIQAFAVCDGHDASADRCPHWRLDNAEAVAAPRTLDSRFASAVAAAAAHQGLQVAEHARALVWVPDARAEIARRAWMLGLSVFGVWLLFELLAALLRQIRRRIGKARQQNPSC